MTPALFFVERERLGADSVLLDGAEGRHAATVRRLEPGERVDLADGAGLVCECMVEAAGRDELTLSVLKRYELPLPSPRLVAVQALPKGDRGELAVEMLTEVGADAIVPWAATRCITQWKGPRGEKSLARWRSSAREAAKQSRRPRIPEVVDVASTREVAALAAGAALAVVLDSDAATSLATLEVPAAGDVLVVVGPEGGITPDELDALRAAGAVPARMGREVLRTSTAGVAALAAIQARTPRWA